ncbi:hypothetical protein ACNKHU_07145 [Shigella flexneri]
MLNLEEAITLRERGWKGPILMLERLPCSGSGDL